MGSTNNIDMVIGNLIFSNGLTFRTCESREMVDIILNDKKVPSDYTIPSRYKIRVPIHDACYTTMREI